MNRKYTVSVNHNEYMTGLFDTDAEAWEKVKGLIQADDPNATELEGNDLWDVADGYGYYVQDVHLPEKETVTLTVIGSTDPWDSRQGERLLIDGQEVLSVIDLTDCPEDAMIGRDLTSAVDVVRIIEKLQRDHAGKAITVEYQVVEWDDF